MRTSFVTVLAVALLGCGDDGGGGGTPDAATGGPDAPTGADAAITADAPATPDANVSADARPAMLDCLGDPIPSSAPNPIEIMGNVYQPGIPGITSDMPVAGASVDAFARGDETTPISQATSDSVGDFAISTDSGGVPVNAYLRTGATGYWTTYLYPPTPVFENLTGVTVVMTNNTQVGLLQNLTGVTFDGDKGWVSLLVLDCDGNPIEGAVVSASQTPGAIAYSDSQGVPSTSESATASDGVAMLFNVPTGTVTVSASVGGMALRSHDVEVNPTSESKMITTAIVP